MSRRGGACPSRLVLDCFHVMLRVSLFEAARRAVAPYECHGPRRTGGSGTRPYGMSGEIQQNRITGGASPSPTGWWGDISRQRTGGRVRRPAPTWCQAKYSKTGQREGQAPPLRGGGETFPGRGQAGGHMGPPLRVFGQIAAGQRGGRAHPRGAKVSTKKPAAQRQPVFDK